MFKKLFTGGVVLIVAAAAMFVWAWFGVPIYPEQQAAQFSCQQDQLNPEIGPDHAFKVMSFNVQYMASKKYVFFYDTEDGPDAKPSLENVKLTIDRVADIIRDENPDVVLLQEVTDAADDRTHNLDQTEALQQRLGELAYPCESSAYYWQMDFLPHPRLAGAIGMELVTLSRHPILESTRYQLPRMPMDAISKHFYFQRALLETHLQVGEKQVAVLNAHYDAWGEGTDVMRGQVAKTMDRLQLLDGEGIPWVLGGDLNLLPPDGDRQRLRIKAAGTGEFDQDTAVKPLYERYRGIPSLEDLNSPNEALWFTHFPNDPVATEPDRTIDYLFYSDQWQLVHSAVRQHDTLDISDHLPVVGIFKPAE